VLLGEIYNTLVKFRNLNIKKGKKMTKTLKMSLVAAVAIAGLTTTASAGAIKTSGFVSYTSEFLGNTDAEAQHDIDVRATFKAQATDTITATVRVDESNEQDAGTNSSSLNMDVDRAFVTVNSGSVATTFGLQGAPLTDGAQADGLTVSSKLGAANVGAGYLYTTAAGAEDVMFLKASGKADMITYNAAFATMAEDKNTAANNKASFLHLGIKANVKAFSVGLDYSSATGLDGTNSIIKSGKDQSQYKLSLGAKLGTAAVSLAYAANGDDGGSTMIDGKDTAGSNISVGETNLQDVADNATAIHLAVSAPLTQTISAKLQYAAISKGDDTTSTVEEKTTRLTVANKLAKNVNAWVEYETYDLSTAKSELTLGVKYSF
jgi:hypothetical protein